MKVEGLDSVITLFYALNESEHSHSSLSLGCPSSSREK